jgi:hypothetical protein
VGLQVYLKIGQFAEGISSIGSGNVKTVTPELKPHRSFAQSSAKFCAKCPQILRPYDGGIARVFGG